MTCRNLQLQAKKEGLPWSVSKGFDTFCPVRSVFRVVAAILKLNTSSDFLPKHQLREPGNVRLWLMVGHC